MSKHILIVEDTPDLLQNLSEFLMMEGFTILPCLSARSAIREFENGVIPDLIVTDLSMPDIDGFQFIEMIKKIESLRDIPVVIFSARPVQENQAHAARLGVAKYIKKPCPPDEFVQSIEEVLKQK
jgi:DNA-binding response OmpR family regulator